MDDHQESVILNVYDMCSGNGYTCYTTLIGLGAFHSGVEVYGTEYAYDGHGDVTSGIAEMEPRNVERLAANFTHKQSIEMGQTCFTKDEVKQAVAYLGNDFLGISYHLTKKNCNHFSSALTQLLCGKKIPAWVNRLSNLSNHLPFLRRFITPTFPDDYDYRVVTPSPSNFALSSSPEKPEEKEKDPCTRSTQTSQQDVLPLSGFTGYEYDEARGRTGYLPPPSWPIA